MPSALINTLASVIIVSLISFVGVLTLSIKRDKLNKILLCLVALSAGSLMGGAFIHLIPEAVGTVGGFTLSISLYILTGLFFAFIIEKFFHWGHQHQIGDRKKDKKKIIGYMSLVGDGFHNFVDGLIIAASYIVSFPLGLATTLAVVFHEVPQELGDFGVLLHAGFKVKKALFFNFLSASFAILGGVVGVWLAGSIEGMIGFLIPFTAGNFIYIAGSNLIPELQQEPSFIKSIFQLISFVIGIGIMFALTLIAG